MESPFVIFEGVNYAVIEKENVEVIFNNIVKGGGCLFTYY